jgi:hypothetical protein
MSRGSRATLWWPFLDGDFTFRVAKDVLGERSDIIAGSLECSLSSCPVAVADLNGDGLLDTVAIAGRSDLPVWYENKSPG